MVSQVAVIRDADCDVLIPEFPWLADDLLVAIPEQSINGLRELSPTFYFDDHAPCPVPSILMTAYRLGYKRMPNYTNWYCGVGNIPADVLYEIVCSAGAD